MFELNTSVDIGTDNVHLSVPFTKVDKAKRMVHGFATLDNLDTQDDIVTYEASQGAFDRFRGNIREMHDKKAVGKMISFRPEKLYDPVSDRVYSGIFVSTYVSKGASDTWEKVIDGTLTGFSIGGKIKKSRMVIDEENDKVVRYVDEYDISELSLVDNPANQLANVISFEKGVDVGYLSKTNSENVFFCSDDNIVQISDGSFASCHQCGREMTNIGFVESNDPDKSTVVKGLLTNAKNAPEIGDLIEFDEGIGRVEAIVSKGEISLPELDGIYKADEVDPTVIVRIYTKNNDTIAKTDHRIIKSLSAVTKVKEEQVENEAPEVDETVVEETVVVETVTEPVEEPAAEEQQEEVVEKSAEEVDDMAELKEMVKSLATSFNELAKSFSALPEMFKGVVASVETAEKAAVDAQETAKAATAELQKAQGENEELGKRLESVEKTTAFKKSADVGDIVQTAPKKEQSIWGGHFLGTTNNL